MPARVPCEEWKGDANNEMNKKITMTVYVILLLFSIYTSFSWFLKISSIFLNLNGEN